MLCGCTCSDEGCTTVVTVRVLPILVGLALLYGLVRLIGGVVGFVSLPPVPWLPIVLLAVAGTIWGLWLGFRVHGRGEPIAVGVFGMLVALVGSVAYSPLILVGLLITLVAAVWSAKARPTGDAEGQP